MVVGHGLGNVSDILSGKDPGPLAGKPIKIDPLTTASFKAKSKWRMGDKVAGFSILIPKVAM